MSWCAVGLHPRRNSNTTSVVFSCNYSFMLYAVFRVPWVCTHVEIQTPHPWFALVIIHLCCMLFSVCRGFAPTSKFKHHIRGLHLLCYPLQCKPRRGDWLSPWVRTHGLRNAKIFFFIVAATRRHKIAGGVVGYDKKTGTLIIAASWTLGTRNIEHIFYFPSSKMINSLPCKKHSINRFQKTSKKSIKKFGESKKYPYLCTRKWEKHRRLKTSASSFKTVENDQIFNPKLTIKIWLESEKLLNFALAFDTNNQMRQDKIRTLIKLKRHYDLF